MGDVQDKRDATHTRRLLRALDREMHQRYEEAETTDERVTHVKKRAGLTQEFVDILRRQSRQWRGKQPGGPD
jgi:hypothetical protein